jgi:membrane-associated phospholipid phosphatase
LVAGSYYIDYQTPLLTNTDILALDGSNINAWDRTSIQYYSKKFDNASDIALYINSALPFTLFLGPQKGRIYSDIAILYGETVALNGAITLMIKAGSKRIRPFTYNPDVPLDEKLKRSTRKSFISGHSSQSAALVFLTAKIYNDVFPESPYKKWVWTSAAILPMVTAVSRVRAGQHFPTDVIAGYVIGACIGIIIPEMHRKDNFFFKNARMTANLNSIGIKWKIQ